MVANSKPKLFRHGFHPVSFLADIGIYLVLTLFFLAIVLPIYHILIVSLAPYSAVAGLNRVYLVPVSFEFRNYTIIFSERTIPNAFRMSAFNTAFGTILAMLVTTMGGYALSKKDLLGRNAILTYFIITMYFGGGLIAWYLLLKDLGFLNNIFVMTVPHALSTYNMILMKNYFRTIPESLEESARIDGAGDFTILLQIIIPCAAPIIATISLFYAVGFWNEWWSAMLFINDAKLHPLQLLLRRVVIESTIRLGDERAASFRNQNVQVYAPGIQMATIMVATIPIMCVYPFVQKYFTKGIMLGAIKS